MEPSTIPFAPEITVPVTIIQSRRRLMKSNTRNKTGQKTNGKQNGKLKSLIKLVKKLTKTDYDYTTRLKNAVILSKNIIFQKCVKKFPAIFTLKQFQEVLKPNMRRRFSQEEKILALSLYKQGEQAYKWLRKIFVLPSFLALNRIISNAEIKPGINKKIFEQLEERVRKMNKKEKLCMLLFNEISIGSNVDDRKRKMVDHVLIFMIRGVVKNYKQPIAYFFSCGRTPVENLKKLIKKVIIKLQECGMHVLGTVCDQYSTNVRAINELIQETHEKCFRNETDVELRNTFHINGKEVVPLFAVPHLIRGIRNNLLNKDLVCIINNEVKTAKWDHLIKLFEQNPTYFGEKMIRNCTKMHVYPTKTCKKTVTYAIQIFSRSVAAFMGYLVIRGMLPEECKQTADVLIFFDELFDSLNGSFHNFKEKREKRLLGPVTPISQHEEVWTKAKNTLQSMKFITKEGRQGRVPSVVCLILTIENVHIIKSILVRKYNVKNIWMRHFNLDPLENFCGCMHSHGNSNIALTHTGLKAVFIYFLIRNLKSHYPTSNCEKDRCKLLFIPTMFKKVAAALEASCKSQGESEDEFF